MNVTEGKKASHRNFVLAWNYGGITSLKLSEDVFDTDYIWQGETLGEVVVRYRLDEGDWREAIAFSSGDIRQIHIGGGRPRGFDLLIRGRLAGCPRYPRL